MPASAAALTSIPSAASIREPRRSAQIPASGEETSIPIAIGVSLMPAVIGSSPMHALEVEDEDEQQREARQAVDERGGGRGGEQPVLEDRQVEHRRGAPAVLDQDEGGKEDGRGDQRPTMTTGSFQPDSPPFEMP